MNVNRKQTQKHINGLFDNNCHITDLVLAINTSKKCHRLEVNKLIIDTKTKFCIYARRAFRLQNTHQ